MKISKSELKEMIRECIEEQLNEAPRRKFEPATNAMEIMSTLDDLQNKYENYSFEDVLVQASQAVKGRHFKTKHGTKFTVKGFTINPDTDEVVLVIEWHNGPLKNLGPAKWIKAPSKGGHIPGTL